MRTVWVLRGEAPESPTADQLAVPDASVHGLAELPDVLAGWA
jgi:putative hydrolase of the HAD superfamily